MEVINEETLGQYGFTENNITEYIYKNYYLQERFSIILHLPHKTFTNMTFWSRRRVRWVPSKETEGICFYYFILLCGLEIKVVQDSRITSGWFGIEVNPNKAAKICATCHQVVRE